MSLYNRFEVIKKVYESDLVVSLYLKAIDHVALPEFKPGQHLLFKFTIPGQDIPIFRYYSFSETYNSEYYRISVKKECFIDNELSKPGLCSSFIFDEIKEGDIVEAKGPSGEFYTIPEEEQPLVLIAGGIGITPLLSMIKSIGRINSQREVYFFYGVNEKADHCFQNELNGLRQKHKNFKISVFYARVSSTDVQGVDYDFEGFITIDAITAILKNLHVDYYICGPHGMMKYITSELENRGIAAGRIHTESFASTISEQESNLSLLASLNKQDQKGLIVEFSRTGRKLLWDPRYKSILEFAEVNEIDITSGCLFGDCGTCLTKIIAGEIEYVHPTMVQPAIGRCLPCSCVPSTDLVLDA